MSDTQYRRGLLGGDEQGERLAVRVTQRFANCPPRTCYFQTLNLPEGPGDRR